MSRMLAIEGFEGGVGVWLRPHMNQHMETCIFQLSEYVTLIASQDDFSHAVFFRSMFLLFCLIFDDNG